MSKAGRTAGLIGAAVGVLAAGAAAGVAVERQVIGRRSGQRKQLEAETIAWEKMSQAINRVMKYRPVEA